MAFEIDHIFILASKGAPEAEQLIQFGLSEGKPNVHPVQIAGFSFIIACLNCCGFMTLRWLKMRSPAPLLCINDGSDGTKHRLLEFACAHQTNRIITRLSIVWNINQYIFLKTNDFKPEQSFLLKLPAYNFFIRNYLSEIGNTRIHQLNIHPGILFNWKLKIHFEIY